MASVVRFLGLSGFQAWTSPEIDVGPIDTHHMEAGNLCFYIVFQHVNILLAGSVRRTGIAPTYIESPVLKCQILFTTTQTLTQEGLLAEASVNVQYTQALR